MFFGLIVGFLRWKDGGGGFKIFGVGFVDCCNMNGLFLVMWRYEI